MRQVGVHFAYPLIRARKGIAESGDVGRAEALFTASAQEVDTLGVRALQTLHQVSRTIRTAVIDNEQVESLRQIEDLLDDLAYVFGLVIGRDNDKRERRMHPVGV